MAEYIERKAVLALQTDLQFDNIEQLKHWKCRRIDPIDVELLPAADVVARDCYDRLLAENDRLRKERPVVRCGECEYRKDARVNEKGFLICPASGMEITDNDYCSYGVSKDGDGE